MKLTPKISSYKECVHYKQYQVRIDKLYSFPRLVQLFFDHEWFSKDPFTIRHGWNSFLEFKNHMLFK